MKKLAIEKLLVWTLCDEMPKGRPVSASPWDLLISYSRLGARVQTSAGAGDGLGFVPGTPHPDAAIVGRALAELPGEVRLPEEDCAVLLGVYAALDPQLVKLQAGRQRYNLQAALVRGAILSPPVWNIGSPCPKPWRREANGQARVFAERDGELIEARAHPRLGGWHHVMAPRCPLAWDDPSLAELLAARAEYAVWWRGLELLYEAVKGTLAEHEALPPEAPARPWLTGAVKPMRVLKAKGGKLARLPLKPERPRALPPVMSEIEARAQKNTRRGNGRARRESGVAKGVLCGTSSL